MLWRVHLYRLLYMLSDFEKDEIECFVNESNTIREVCVKLGYSKNRSGKTLAKVSAYLKTAGITTGHFKNINTLRSSLTQDEIFKADSPLSNTTIKNRVIQSNLVEYICAECGNVGEHNGKPLSLQLDHKDGCNSNNNLSNLRFLCPNCHAQTDTFGGRNKTYK